jgi:uncharacterized membrane protein
MQDLKNIKTLVNTILEKDERARNSDSFLYFRVIEAVGKSKGMNIHRIPVAAYLLNMGAWGFP